MTLACRNDVNRKLGGVLAIDELIDVKASDTLALHDCAEPSCMRACCGMRTWSRSCAACVGEA